MKRFVVFLLGVLLIPNLVFADMGAPMIEEYKVAVSNENGAVIYVEEEQGEDEYVYVVTKLKLAPGEQFTIGDADEDASDYISFFFKDEGKQYVTRIDDEVYYDEEDPTSKGYQEGYVLTRELKAVKDSYKKVKSDWAKEESVKVLVDQEIRKGPGFGYSSVGKTIPALTTIKAQHNSRWDNPWMYVEYEGFKGYICAYNGQIGFDKTKTTIKASTETPVYDKNENKIATIKLNEEKEVTLYDLDAWTRSYFVEYGDVKGYVISSMIAIKQKEMTFQVDADNSELVLEVLDALDENYTVVAKLKNKETFTTKYYNGEGNFMTVYYEKDGVKGWISDNYGTKEDKKGNITKYLLYVYEEPEDDDEDDADVVLYPTDTNPGELAPTKKLDIVAFAMMAAGVLLIIFGGTIMFINRKKEMKKDAK